MYRLWVVVAHYSQQPDCMIVHASAMLTGVPCWLPSGRLQFLQFLCTMQECQSCAAQQPPVAHAAAAAGIGASQGAAGEQRAHLPQQRAIHCRSVLQQ